MTWIKQEDDRSLVQKFCTRVLQQGPLPKHIGFILDGNRRYARGKHLAPVEGHRKGFDKLSQTLRWCLDLGVEEVTVFVFSIENFKRSREEVEGLMILAKEKFNKLLSEEDNLMKEGVCIQVVGDWSLVPADLRPLMAKAMTMTRYNTRAKLNIAFAYTSRNEITRGMRSLHEGLLEDDISLDDVDPELLEEMFCCLPSHPLDLLVRTSGETRLSDFLLWQSSETVLCFAEVLWPDFSYWHLLKAVFQFQVDRVRILHQIPPPSDITEMDLAKKQRRELFVEKFRDRRWRTLIEESTRVS